MKLLHTVGLTVLTLLACGAELSSLLESNFQNAISPGWYDCEAEGTQASGYISIPGTAVDSEGHATEEEKHIFYWMFGPRKSPKSHKAQDVPVVLWLSGGPGCSSTMALLQENGPCRMNETSGELYSNRYGWNDAAYLIYVDQPVGVGYSYTSDEANYVKDSEEVARDMYQFLQAFAQKMTVPSIVTQQFILAGESYAGHYVPAIADYIRRQNARIRNGEETRYVLLNLDGIIVGNGWTDPHTQAPSYTTLAYDWCEQKLGEPCITAEERQKMEDLLPLCQSYVKQCNTEGDPQQEGACLQARVHCNDYFSFYMNSGRNVYDIRKPCIGGEMCYPMENATTFLNRQDVRVALGAADATTTGEWTACQHKVGQKFTYDGFKNYNHTLPLLLADHIRVLMFAGDMDFICNWIGNKDYLLALQWPGHDGFNKANDREFKVGGAWAGRTRSYQNLTFVQVYGAGHMVPMDQPEVALHILTRFIENKPMP
ncbi:serine carboxypeptidase (CBP1) [Angomonas deanei]|nr:serine carboxypeptidase (CBP1) [Angomonas deanei]|eukprot:EPY43687.1 serine carboxypeptidase (CBP1) [Angomonas deanei]